MTRARRPSSTPRRSARLRRAIASSRPKPHDLDHARRHGRHERGRAHRLREARALGHLLGREFEPVEVQLIGERACPCAQRLHERRAPGEQGGKRTGERGARPQRLSPAHRRTAIVRERGPAGAAPPRSRARSANPRRPEPRCLRAPVRRHIEVIDDREQHARGKGSARAKVGIHRNEARHHEDKQHARMTAGRSAETSGRQAPARPSCAAPRDAGDSPGSARARRRDAGLLASAHCGKIQALERLRVTRTGRRQRRAVAHVLEHAHENFGERRAVGPVGRQCEPHPER